MLFEEMIPKMPIVTIQNPYGWKYKIKGMVTGQSTTGTGVISEFASGFTDFFGMQSGRHNDKIRAGEELCAYQLKMKAFNMGADAIVGVDIDYAELGGGKGMIMVCMSGTAVELENKEIFGEWFEDYAKKLQENQIRYAHLSKLDKKS
jgi:uncharacterized protein YbjQ (UPF0145 family)